MDTETPGALRVTDQARVPRHAFLLFVTGDTTRAQRAAEAIRTLCERCLGDDFVLTVVDVLVDTHLAEDHNVIATPTLIRTSPAPARRVLGDLADPARVAVALDMELPTLQRDGLT